MFLRRHVKEPKVPGYAYVLRAYDRLLHVSLRHPAVTVAICIVAFAASLLLVPFIGAEFMPHLDEGSLWIRATMPYTISFEEASKLGPQVRDLLQQFPQVTTVANELGRPDDGTDPIGFFNDEYFVGLKPYDDPAWRGSIRTKPELIAADPGQAAGVSRHHLQLHAAGGRRGGRGRDRSEELARGEDLRRRSDDAGSQRGRGPARDFQRARDHARVAGPRARAAEPDD